MTVHTGMQCGKSNDCYCFQVNCVGVKLLSISRSCLTVDSNESQVKTSMPKAKQVGPPKSKKKKRKKQSNSSSSDTR